VWYAFLLGVFAYWALAGTIPRAVFYVYSAVLFGYAIPSHNIDAVVAVLTGLLLLEAGRLGGLHEWLSWRPLQFLGTISYSLYLMQHPISSATLDQLYAWTPRTASYEVSWLAVLLAAICAGAWLFWRVVERPCTALSHYCKPRRR
jgi:peptidoglycan/LPS O-acetylase OafA/YrhL